MTNNTTTTPPPPPPPTTTTRVVVGMTAFAFYILCMCMIVATGVDSFVVLHSPTIKATTKTITTTTTGTTSRSSSRLFTSTTTTTTSTTSSINDIQEGSESSSSSSSSSFSNFDYLSHWYPVIWARDVPLNKPTKVTVFDVDYVIAKTNDNNNNNNKKQEEEVVAMVDICPHKQAALSEGRITTTGKFQCAYHGWSFNGTTGECVQIPQSPGSTGSSPRTWGTAVPAMIHQNMIWIFPGGTLEQALLAPPPPTIPELDTGKYKTRQTIRDFPTIDWTILLENIMDPDHGLFAHQAKPFDLYSANATIPQTLQEEFTNQNKSWTITSKVQAVEKLITRDQEKRGIQHNNKKKNNNKKKKDKTKKDEI